MADADATGAPHSHQSPLKIENDPLAAALHFLDKNFCRVHQAGRVTPAVRALVSKPV
jgi:hypothetical protein